MLFVGKIIRATKNVHKKTEFAGGKSRVFSERINIKGEGASSLGIELGSPAVQAELA